MNTFMVLMVIVSKIHVHITVRVIMHLTFIQKVEATNIVKTIQNAFSLHWQHIRHCAILKEMN